jgi:hypothetical protein
LQTKRIVVWVAIALSLVAAAFLIPAMLTTGCYDNWPKFTIVCQGLRDADFARTRYVELSEGIVAGLDDTPDKYWLSESHEAVASSANSVTVRLWFGGGFTGFWRTGYQQTYAVLLLVPMKDGTYARRLVVLPDLRKSKSATVDFRDDAR